MLLADRRFGRQFQIALKVCFNRAMGHPHILIKNDLAKFRNHLSRAKFPQISAISSRGAFGMLFGQLAEVLAAIYFINQFFADVFIFNEYVPGTGSWHSFLL